VVQHSDLDTQKEFYPFLREAAEQGELSIEDMALLEDRIALFEGKPQRYGSQIVEDSTGERVIYTLLNTDSVNIWRSAAGMPPLEEYAKQMNAKWNK
ncbi:MAG: tetratricopeptide repeat protein, partial [Paludibacteraceae bacterium]|nr:tetratricopeptide repeat protein [Paludibacteraceae bacterium]